MDIRLVERYNSSLTAGHCFEGGNEETVRALDRILINCF